MTTSLGPAASDMAGNLVPLERIRKDLRETARLLSPHEARYLVDLYYQVQDYRIRAAAQVRAAIGEGETPVEPHALTQWVFQAFIQVEDEIRKMLGVFAAAHDAGAWALSVHGIGPVLAAGLVAHIDITKAPTAGHIWSFAGLDPTKKWEKGKKRPWNAALKVLCWKLGDSFVKQSGSPKCVYGHLYRQRKEIEVRKNDAGDFAAQAAETLASKKFKDSETRTCYEGGKLPPGRIDLRARRWAVKIFLSHYHDVAYTKHYGVAPPAPFAIAILGHAHNMKIERE